MLFRAKAGLPWSDPPERYGPWKSGYDRFANWAKRGHRAALFRELQLAVDETTSIVDGSVVCAHQDASGGKGGVDAMLWAAPGGPAHEMIAADELLARARGKALIGDTGYAFATGG